KQQQKFVAELSNLRKVDCSRYVDEIKRLYGEDVQPYYYYAHIFGDTATHGNHPFRDGLNIHTSYVLNEYERDGERFIQTMNTLYKVRSNDNTSD
ncbi:hypothetical protein, partial [Herbiconiux daphne]